MKHIFVGILMLIVASCGQQVPNGIIAQQKMADVLIDVHLADAHMSNLPLDSGRKVLASFYQGIFEKYRIDSASLVNSIQYYAEKPYLYSKIYDQVESRINAMNETEQKLFEAKVREQMVADSLRNVFVTDSLWMISRDVRRNARMKEILFVANKDSLQQADSVFRKKPLLSRHKELHRQLFENTDLERLFRYYLEFMYSRLETNEEAIGVPEQFDAEIEEEDPAISPAPTPTNPPSLDSSVTPIAEVLSREVR